MRWELVAKAHIGALAGLTIVANGLVAIVLLQPFHGSHSEVASDVASDRACFPDMVVSAFRAISIVSAISGLAGFYAIYKNHLPSLRFFAVWQLFDLFACGLAFAAVSFVLMSRLSVRLGHLVCNRITHGERTNRISVSLSFSMLDGLENCEERWPIFAFGLVMLFGLGLVIQAYLVGTTWTQYRYLLRKSSILGKIVPLSVNTHLASSSRSNSCPSTNSLSPKLRASFAEMNAFDKRQRANTYSHAPRLVLVASPYTFMTPPASPLEDTSPTPTLASLVHPGRQMSRRATHSQQPSEQYMLIPSSSPLSTPRIPHHSPLLVSSPDQLFAESPFAPSLDSQT